MKKLIPYVLGLAIAALVLVPVFSIALGKSSSGLKVFLNAKQMTFDVQPQLMNGTVMVPLRGIFEQLGAEVRWDASTNIITVANDQNEIKVIINKKTAFKNGEVISLNVSPVISGGSGRVLVPLRLLSEALGVSVQWDATRRTVYLKNQNASLPVVGSYEKLKELLSEAQPSSTNYGKVRAMEEQADVGNAPAVRLTKELQSTDYSSTNIQVQGVDEADLVKTDGKYIYQVNNRRVVVTRAYPAEEMKIASIIKFDDERYVPQELYVDAKYLVVIGSSGFPVCRQGFPGEPEICPPSYGRNTVKVIIYDLSDKTKIKKLREVELEGNYVSSRKIDSALYLVTNKYLEYHILTQDGEGLTPIYRDTAINDNFVKIGYPDIRYFPGAIEPNYLIVAGINLDHLQEKVQVATYLGAGENIYASLQHLYVAVSRDTMHEENLKPAGVGPSLLPMPETSASTVIYQFALDQGRVDYQCKGEVPGTILNQFALDEYQGNLRVATTRGDIWRNDEGTSKNNVYILGAGLKITGKLENIAPGEKIYSVRFMGDRGYLVTFRTVDPLFVIDLKNPQAPQILGALKIPGYSDYLHPYDENHIIGFGKDTVEVAQKDRQGNQTGSMAYYQGMKMAIFDVSDVRYPREKFSEIIGDRGTDSELLHNHKALLFAKDINLLAFPVTVMEVKGQGLIEKRGMPAYGQFVFQGAYVYNIDLVHGFRLKGKITHLTDANYLSAGAHWYYSDKNIARIIYVDDTLYTLSQGMIKAHRMTDLQEKNSLIIPEK